MPEIYKESVCVRRRVTVLSTHEQENGTNVESWKVDRTIDPAADSTDSVVYRNGMPLKRRRGAAIDPPPATDVEQGRNGDWEFDMSPWFARLCEIARQRFGDVPPGRLSVRCDVVEHHSTYWSDLDDVADFAGASRWVAGAVRIKEPELEWDVYCFDSFEATTADDVVDRVAVRRSRREVARRAPTFCPSDRRRVVLDAEVAATFFHECVGHWLEADFANPERESLLGSQIAIAGLSVEDDATRDGPGRLVRDDEGVSCTLRHLIDHGRLVGRICDRNMRRHYGSGSPATAWWLRERSDHGCRTSSCTGPMRTRSHRPACKCSTIRFRRSSMGAR